MTPLQFLARLAALIPPPRHPLIRFHGVFAPHSSWRKSVVPAPSPCRPPEAPLCDRTPAPKTEGPLPYIPWAELLRRTYDADALRCPCGGRLRFIAVILEAEAAREILDALGLPSAPPPISRARSPDFLDPLPSDD